MATLNLHPIRLSILGTPLVGQEVEVRVLIGHPMETGYRLGLVMREYLKILLKVSSLNSIKSQLCKQPLVRVLQLTHS